MAASDFNTLVSKVMTDDGFAASLVANTRQTLEGAGIQATPEILDALKGVDVAALKQLATSFKEDQAAAV